MEIKKEEIQNVFAGTGQEMNHGIGYGCDDECVGGTASRKRMKETN